MDDTTQENPEMALPMPLLPYKYFVRGEGCPGRASGPSRCLVCGNASGRAAFLDINMYQPAG